MPEFIAPLQPVESWRVTQPFRPGQHYGMDFGNADGTALTVGTPVLAIADGTVVLVANEPGGAGLHTNVNHAGGVQSRDFHLSGFNVAVGQDVQQGDVIGFSGNTGSSTGPHLHHEHRVNGVAVDPSPFLNARAPAPPPEESEMATLYQTPTTIVVLDPPIVTDIAPEELPGWNALVSAGFMKLEANGTDANLKAYRATYQRYLSTLPKGGSSTGGASATQLADELARRLVG